MSYSEDSQMEMQSEQVDTYRKKKLIGFAENTFDNTSEDNSEVSIYKNECLYRKEEAHKKQIPKLLAQLEFFLQKELFLLGVGSHDVNDIALQAHQEAFEYLIDNFKSYKRMLSCIKNAYEFTLSTLKSQLHNLTMLKQMVVITAEKYEKRIMDIYDEKKQELIAIENQNQELLKKVNIFGDEKRNIEYIMDRLKQEVNDINENFNNETTRHKMLVTEINNLYAQQQFTAKQLQRCITLESITSDDEDPVTLQNAVSEAREKERNASQMLSIIAADYCDVIPRKEFDAIKKKFDEEKVNFDDLMNTFKIFGSEHSILLKMNQSLTEERNHYYSQQKKLQSVSASIDYWNTCIKYITGGEVNWQEVSNEKASKDLLEILLQTVNAKDAAHLQIDICSFTGKGLSSNIPKLLKYEGDVKIRRMTQRDCVYMIKDIWSQRVYEDKCNFVDFLESYMEKQFPDADLRIEWIYTFYFTVKHFSPINNYIKLTWKILNEEADESMYHCLEILTQNLMKLCYENEKNETEYLNKKAFREILQEYLRGAKPEFVSSLVEKAVLQLESDKIDIKKLISKSGDGDMGPFLISIREWFRKAWKNFIEYISKTTELRYIYPEDVATWLEKSLNNNMKPLSVIKLQCWCFNLKKKELATSQPISLENIIIKLNQVGFVYK